MHAYTAYACTAYDSGGMRRVGRVVGSEGCKKQEAGPWKLWFSEMEIESRCFPTAYPHRLLRLLL